MTQITKRFPKTPTTAARRRAAIDASLDTELFKALSDPTRARLFACLLKCGRPCSVSEVAECCDVDFSVVARHLATLARAGVLTANKDGRTMWYEPRWTHLATTFHALADAVDEWRPTTDTPRCNPGCCD
ncbi:MAG: metalloregulator ArsR/SmtB family transcription factor [Phycisphaerales bacterium]